MPRLQRRAPTVVGRRPRASRAVRGGFRGATGGYFVYRLFCKSRCVYTRRGSFSEADSNRDGRSNEARGPGVSEGACVGQKEPVAAVAKGLASGCQLGIRPQGYRKPSFSKTDASQRRLHEKNATQHRGDPRTGTTRQVGLTRLRHSSDESP